MIRNNTPIGVEDFQPLQEGEIVDLERMNFVEWYRTATAEDLAVARRNNMAKLEELRKKYAGDVAVIDAIRGAENN